MAAFHDAEHARDRLVREGERLLGFQPKAVGIVVRGKGNFGVKVTLPRDPDHAPLAVLDDVPIEYDVQINDTRTLGDEPAWLAAARRTRANRR